MAPPSLEAKTSESTSEQAPPNVKHNKANKVNHHHGHRHSCDSTSSSSSSVSSSSTQHKTGHSRNATDNTTDFDRLKQEVPINAVVNCRGASVEKREREEPRKVSESKPEPEEQKRKDVVEEASIKPPEPEQVSKPKEPEEREAQTQNHCEEMDVGEQDKCDKEETDKDDGHKDRRDRVSSVGSNSSVRNSSKRRHNSHDSNDSPTEESHAQKKHKQNNVDGSRIFERRDSGKDGKKEKHHKSHNRSEKSSKCSSVSSSSSEKSVSHLNALNKHDNHDEKQQFLLDERRKEITFSNDGHAQQQSHHQKKKERYHDKHKNKKDHESCRDKENTQSVNFPQESFTGNRSTSDEEDQTRSLHKADRKCSKDYAAKRYHSESGGDTKKYDRKLSRAESSADEEGRKKKNRSNHNRTKMTNSSDTDDSDEPKKHSIFDIPDEGPNISMYDKVKARSCKNMQKQEEEKKIKEKFSKLKQCRAKREGKNRSKSWDEDSDSDANSDTTINSKYNHKDQMNKSGMITTSDDDDHMPSTPRFRRHNKEPLASDSEDENHRIRFNRDRLNNLCDDESSDGERNKKNMPHTPRRSSSEKKMSRKNSRSTRIQSDSDSDNDSTMDHAKIANVNQSSEGDKPKQSEQDSEKAHVAVSKIEPPHIKQEIKCEEDASPVEAKKVEIKVETKVQPPSALVTSDVSDDDTVKPAVVKSEFIPSTMIKKEPVDDGYSYSKERPS